MNFQELWDSYAQNKTSEILKKMTFNNCGTPVRRTKRRKSQQKLTFGISGTAVRRTKRRKSKNMDFQEFGDACAQNKTSEISRNALSEILRLLCAEQDVGNVKKCIVIMYGTSVRRTKRRKSQKAQFQEFGDSCAQNEASDISNNCNFRISWNIVRRTQRPTYQIMYFHNV